MRQIVQDIKSGQTKVVEVPVPTAAPGMVLVRTHASLVSAGTERTLVSFADSSLLGKAQQRPDLVRQVLDKVRREGLLTTIQAVRSRLEQPLPLGYSSAGTVIEVGQGVNKVRPGDRVACGGGGFAVHAEYALVPRNLVAPVPEGVSMEAAAFATLGSVALHGFRMAETTVGERVAVIGLGVLGQLSMRIAEAAGCRALGIDISAWRVEQTNQRGQRAVLRDRAVEAATAVTEGHGFDAVLICADANDSDPVELAGELARDRAVVVAIGAVGMDLPRRPYYDKELSFVVSRSYGPGRYDSSYEEAGVDYPIGYVRWPEGRNMQAMLDLMEAGKLDPTDLISHRFVIKQGQQAYQLITSDQGERALGVLLQYPEAAEDEGPKRRVPVTQIHPSAQVRLGVAGAGNFATNVLLPKLKNRTDLDLVGLASARGLSSSQAAERFGFQFATSQFRELVEDNQINTLAVLTRHNLHAEQVAIGLEAGRHVFCEKPLAIDWQGLDQVQHALAGSNSLLTVGFNRRFAPLMRELKESFSTASGPKIIHYRVNAGSLPSDHWLLDPALGGGRLIGEGCHFIDALCFLAGSPPLRVYARSLGGETAGDFVLTVNFSDGSVGSVVYTSMGDRTQGKERVEVFGGGKSAVLDDFRRLDIYSNGRKRSRRSRWSQDKGHEAIWAAFVSAIHQGGPPPIGYQELFSVSAATLAANDSVHSGQPITLDGSAAVSDE